MAAAKAASADIVIGFGAGDPTQPLLAGGFLSLRRLIAVQ